MLFFISRDFVLALLDCFFRFMYQAKEFFLSSIEKRCNWERERLIEGVKKEYCFFVIIYSGFC